MLTFLGGVPRQIVCDNLRAGTTRACFYEPMVNRTYTDLASHYRTAVLPARPYKPRDKAKVEVGVQVVQRWILARLRNRRFFSLGELNEAIRELVTQLNDRPMRGCGTTRRALYEQVDKPALLPLPSTPYEYAQWKRCRVNIFRGVQISVAFSAQHPVRQRITQPEGHRICNYNALRNCIRSAVKRGDRRIPPTGSNFASARDFVCKSISAYTLVVVREAWPNHPRIVLMSTPARSK
jgi:hypothetical protein